MYVGGIDLCVCLSVCPCHKCLCACPFVYVMYVRVIDVCACLSVYVMYVCGIDLCRCLYVCLPVYANCGKKKEGSSKG